MSNNVMTKKQLDLLYSKCKERIDEKICQIADNYGGHASIIGCDWERELMDCLSGGMPLDQTVFRQFLRRLAQWMSYIEARLDMEAEEGPTINLGDLYWKDANGYKMTAYAFEYTFDNNMQANIYPAGVTVESLTVTEN